MVGNTVITLSNDEAYLCKCDSNQHYYLRYYAYTFNSNSASNIAHSNLEELQNAECASNECIARDYYTAKQRLVSCTHPDESESNAQGESNVGDKYLDITLSNNGLLCYNDNACSNLCLVSGPSNNLQIGDGVYDNETSYSNPEKCYTYG